MRLNFYRNKIIKWVLFLLLLFISSPLLAAELNVTFPLKLESYQDNHLGLLQVLKNRLQIEPFNLVVSIIFLCAIVHAFLANKIIKISNAVKAKHLKSNKTTSIKAEILHFLGEVEAVFGLWVLVLMLFFVATKGWIPFVSYISQVNYTEPVFVVVIMALAASRPIVNLAESNVKILANWFGGGIAAYWFCILTVAPILGSFVTEPAAMTVAALLLARQFYANKPPKIFAYATLGLLFVNVSIGGTLTQFAAPPVLIVANVWQWDLAYMVSNFGWKAIISIVIANLSYFLIFRKEFKKMKTEKKEVVRSEKVPVIITLIHIIFIIWTVATTHYIPLFLGGFLFFIAFTIITRDFQSPINLKSPLLVGFFLAGLVIHGGLQGWWIDPVLERLTELQLFWGAVGLTAFNDNAAITYLSTLVPNFSETMKYAVVAGALTGGGLTVIANAPNPAGQAILGKYFDGGISPLGLFLGALLPTLIAAACFILL